MPGLRKRNASKGKPRAQPTEKQAKFVDGLMTGLSASAAAVAAGSAPQSSFALMKSETVRAELAAARRWLVDETQIRRLDCIEGIMEFIEIARLTGDATAGIKGWAEVAKMLGHYAPEKKQIDLTIGQQRLRSKFEAMSDEELMRLVDGTTIEGESQREDEPKEVLQ